MLYYLNILLNGDASPRSIYQSAILSSFRAFSKLLQLQYFQKAAELESIYLSQNNLNVTEQDLFDTHLIYQQPAETMQTYDQALVQIFHN